MPTPFQHVGNFHHKFGLYSVTHDGVKQQNVPDDLVMFRLKFLEEELRELKEAYENDDLIQVADSLVDLEYVTLGTAHLHGFPYPQLFAEVQRANMEKERCIRQQDSSRGSTWDVIKPAGWRPPNIRGVLLGAGFKV